MRCRCNIFRPSRSIYPLVAVSERCSAGNLLLTAPMDAWLRRVVREPLRTRFFQVLRSALTTDDGRAILDEALVDRLAWMPASRLQAEWLEPPFAELGRSRAVSSTPRPIFITARFRTGSTLLWKVFRHLHGFTSYYEPFNERRWFDPRRRGSRVDTTHGVDEYWREYDSLGELSRHYNEDWIRRRLYMDGRAWDPDMAAYVDTLVARAKGRPVLQFNRIDFRLPWFRHTFPNAILIHLYRHPRDQWCSTFPTPDEYPCSAPASDYPAHDHFYLRCWAADLKQWFPFLDERRSTHPYELFYYIWRLSYCLGVTYCHHSLSFEQLVAQPVSTLSGLFAAAGIDDALVAGAAALVKPAESRWRAYADDSWFRAHEERCDGVLRAFFRIECSAERCA